jgi:carboxypeptidase T
VSLLSAIFQREPSYRPGGDNRFYMDLNGAKVPARQQFDAQCIDLDVDEDRFLTDEEFGYLTEDVPFKIDPERYIQEHKHAWSGVKMAEHELYPSYDELTAQLQDLQGKHPGRAELVSLGKSHQGREIWALRLGEHSAGEQPGVVITGGTHAREWASITLPLELAGNLLENDAGRLSRSEIWIVPLVNPDGYEHSRNEDSTYRKNCRPGHGVDLNRNFADPQHPTLWRPEGDRPKSTMDDKGGSDKPSARQYRGPNGNSEPETRALLDLQLGRPNVRGVLDHHNCGEMLIYPNEGNKEIYEPLTAAMNQALGGQPYRVLPARELYETSGISTDVHHVHGLISVTMESGLSFQPPAQQLQDIHQRGVPAQLAFIDYVLATPPPAAPSNH